MNVVIKEMENYLTVGVPWVSFVVMEIEDYKECGEEGNAVEFVGSVKKIREYISYLAKSKEIKGKKVSKKIMIFIRTKDQVRIDKIKKMFKGIKGVFETDVMGTFSYMDNLEISGEDLVKKYPEWVVI
jgi:hypothetical protein